MDKVDSESIKVENLEIEEKATAEGGTDDADARKWTDAIFDAFHSSEKDKSKPTATTPVSRDSDKYNMNHSKRGTAVIFNHMKFTNGQSTRHGTDKDELKLKYCLQALGFEVIVHRDIKRIELFKTLDYLREEDHSNSDCLVIIVMSHGEQDKIFSSDSDYRPEDLWNPFTADLCPTLAGKPKIFFIQACRGDQFDAGTKLMKTRTQTDSRSSAEQEMQTYTIPNRADFLIVFSTAPGYYSWRNTQEGSWFVQTLTKVLTENKDKKDLLSMMTIVTREVALNFESNVPGNPTFDQKKQVPMITSTLTRDVYL